MEKSVNSSARSPVRAMRSGLCRRTSSSRYRLSASKRLPCRSEICTIRSPENASGSAAQAAVTVLVESVKFQTMPRLPAPAPPEAASGCASCPVFLLHTEPSCVSIAAILTHSGHKEKQNDASARRDRPAPAKNPCFAPLVSTFCIVIFGLKCYNSRKRKIMDVHWN